jgi:choline dehydrogenase-like flavoprotein
MSEADRYDILVLGSGTGGKLVAWEMAGAGKRIAAVERRLSSGSWSAGPVRTWPPPEQNTSSSRLRSHPCSGGSWSLAPYSPHNG